VTVGMQTQCSRSL